MASPSTLKATGRAGDRRFVGAMNPAERRSYQLACRHFENGDADGALTHFTDLLRTQQGYADVHYRVGVLHERKGDLGAAARSLWQALRLNPSYAEAILALTSVYESQGDFDRAREIAERARFAARPSAGRLDATTRGKLSNLQAQLGDALLEAGEAREAIDCYGRALDRCPQFHDIRLRLGMALRDAGLPDRSASELRRVLEARPEMLVARVQLGVTLHSLGRAHEAIWEWNRVLESDPTRRDALMYLRLVRV